MTRTATRSNWSEAPAWAIGSYLKRPSNHVVVTQARGPMRSIENRLTLTMPRRGTQQCCSANSSKLCALGSTVIWCGWRGWPSVNIISRREAVGKIAFPSTWRHDYV